jgi:hypothetical protein
VRVLSRVFRGKYLELVRAAFAQGRLHLPARLHALAEPRRFAAWLRPLYAKDWVVHSKPPFGGPEQVLKYLARYTHRVAISNSRLISCDGGQVVFHYRDRAAGDVRKTLTLPADEFLRRFLSHVLPAGFQRIHHYGLLASRTKKQDLTRCRELLAAPKPEPLVKKSTAEWVLFYWGIDINRCPRCGQRSLECTVLLPQRGPSPPPPSAPTAPKILDTS